MKHCPKCRVESRPDAVWCWHCGYSYEDADAAQSEAQDGRNRMEPAAGTEESRDE